MAMLFLEQFFFDKNFTKVNNGIPTINANLLSTKEDMILSNAPDFQTPFKQIGLQSMDYIMSQNNQGKLC